jgi:hypothetical protein
MVLPTLLKSKTKASRSTRIHTMALAVLSLFCFLKTKQKANDQATARAWKVTACISETKSQWHDAAEDTASDANRHGMKPCLASHLFPSPPSLFD